jgi:hypothetical protein
MWGIDNIKKQDKKSQKMLNQIHTEEVTGSNPVLPTRKNT